MADIPGIFAIPMFAVSAAVWAELIGVPVAWLKLRRTQVWIERPPHARRLDLLAAFSGRITFLAAMFGGVAGLATWIGELLG